MNQFLSYQRIALLALVWGYGLSGLANDAPPAGLVPNSIPAATTEPLPAMSSMEADMRSENFDRRQQAMLRLWANRELYRPWVEKAIFDPDPEVARRANWVLDRWRRGLLPETPHDLAIQLGGATAAETIDSLLNAGLFDGALVAIDEAISSGQSPLILSRADSALRRRFPFYVRIAGEQDQLPQLLEILDRLADDAPLALAFQQLRKLISGEDDDSLPTAAARWPKAQRARFEVILRAADGDLNAATRLAEQSQDAELRRVCRMLSGQWQELAQEQLSLAKSQPPDSLDWYRHWMYTLIAASRCDDESIRDQAVAQLSRNRSTDTDPMADIDEHDPINRIRWQSLAMHGEIDAAIKILQPQQPDAAAELLAQTSQFTKAYQALDVDWADVDAQLAALVKDAVRGERKERTSDQDTPSPELARLLTVSRLLILTGRDSMALDALKAVASDPSLGANNSAALTKSEIIRAVARLNRREWISQIIVGPTDTTLHATTHFYLAMIFDCENETLAALLEAFAKMRPSASYASRVADVVAFLDGEVSQEFDPAKDYQKLYATMANSKRVIRSGGGSMQVANVSRLSLDLAKLFELHGQPELSKRTLTALHEQGETEATLKLAEVELNDGSAEVARQLFASVWQRIEIRGKDLARLNEADKDILIAMKAIQGEATAMARLGDDEGASQLKQLIRMMTCAPAAALRDSFAEYLVEQGDNETAAEIYESMLPLAAFGASEGAQFYRIARNYDAAVADTKSKQAAAMLDLAIAGTLENTVFYPSAYVSLPSYLHRRLIRNAIKQRDEAEVRVQVEKLFRLDPIDIDFGEKVLESMREAEMKDLATDILERIYQAGNSHLENFPLDVGMSNNLAWVLSLSDYRLEEALQMSKQAVFYNPDSTIYRDTLAEVLFRLNRKAEAIAIEKACLLDDPGEWHVHEQLKRFENTLN